MTPKILVADDSPTIQKVIGITLASENFEIIKCEDENSLESLVSEHKPELVLLDYNLSEALTGYDLVENIRKIHQARVIFLYGTFDTIDESLNNQFNIDGSMVKPFDAKKFIHLCRDTIALDLESDSTQMDSSSFDAEEIEDFEDYDSNESDYDPDSTDKFELGEDWQVNQPLRDDNDDLTSEDVISTQEKNELEAGMEDWGVAVPGVIDQADSSSVDLPPVIDAAEEVLVESEDLIPSDDDLEYPDIEEKPTGSNNTPQLVSMEELNEDVSDVDSGIPSEGIDLNSTSGTDTIEEVQALEDQIADETNIEDDIWSADEVHEDPDAHRFFDETTEVQAPGRRTEDTRPEQTRPINTEIGEKTDPMMNPLLNQNIENINQSVKDSLDPVIEKIVKEEVAKVLERVIREEAQRAIEKVAWEIIPDLAENIIKEQLSRLADDVASES
ncbi:MAG: hypothetical protein CME65_11010 [Halobacteriovoraceae bacterium]|nr:hypothetical protein [Halobacteriovoraceae bacterium]|tara:strand:- start:4660 stop:5991 length:1332 start_codon:yes stop_codon:yes gene_type:complete